MIFQLRKLLLLSLLFFCMQIAFAQDDLAGYCDLPATQDIIFTSIGPDHLGFNWTPVQNASAYDVLIIDLNTNITAHQSTENVTEFFIEDIEVTECTFVSITSRCSDNTLGGTAGVNPGTCALIFDDLVLQVTTDNGSTIKLMCGELISNKSAPHWGTPTGTGTIKFNLNPSSIVLSEIHETYNNINNKAYSILMLGIKNSEAYSIFPSYTNLTYQQINTTYTPLPSHPADAEIDNDQNQLFYNVLVDQSTSIVANLDFANTYLNNVSMETRYCTQGVRLPFTKKENRDRESTYLQSNNHSGSIDFIANSVSKTDAFSVEELSLAPNPTSDQLNIRVPTIGNLKIIDINGHIWHATTAQHTHMDIPVANWPAGTYIIHFEGTDAPIVKRFVKF